MRVRSASLKPIAVTGSGPCRGPGGSWEFPKSPFKGMVKAVVEDSCGLKWVELVRFQRQKLSF